MLLALPGRPASMHILVSNSRREDAASLGCVVMSFHRTSLPWQGRKSATKKQKYEKLSGKMMSTPAEVLSKGLPK